MHRVAVTQPMPSAGSGDVMMECIEDTEPGPVRDALVARREFGIQKYGTTLQRDNGRDHETDCAQEFADAVVYARAAGRRDLEELAREGLRLALGVE
jgi:hypothetical protein